jgi:hypothetical protein
VLPTKGRIVHYRLNDADASLINQRIENAQMMGNRVSEGEYYAAMVVRIFEGNPYGVVNLQVFLDGDGSYWASSRKEGDEAGTWTWPPQVSA